MFTVVSIDKRFKPKKVKVASLIHAQRWAEEASADPTRHVVVFRDEGDPICRYHNGVQVECRCWTSGETGAGEQATFTPTS